MITPLGQRQLFQTATVESSRAAQEVSEQLQREKARHMAAEAKIAAESAAVKNIADTEKLRAEARQQRRSKQEHARPEAEPEEATHEDAQEMATSTHVEYWV